MDMLDSLRGRKERRLPVVVVVNFASREPVSPEKHERTCTDNISAHGVRVRSIYSWQLGEEVEIALASGSTPLHGKVVYCERLQNDHLFVGVNLRESTVRWPILLFRFVDISGFELHTLTDSEHQLPVPQIGQMISIEDTKMQVEAVTLQRANASPVTVYNVRVRLIPEVES